MLDVSLDVEQGEFLVFVGPSGCGKSTTGRAILQLYRPTTGHVWFKGQDLTAMKGNDLRSTRRHLQMIFQDPYSSLNARMNVREYLALVRGDVAAARLRRRRGDGRLMQANRADRLDRPVDPERDHAWSNRTEPAQALGPWRGRQFADSPGIETGTGFARCCFRGS